MQNVVSTKPIIAFSDRRATTRVNYLIPRCIIICMTKDVWMRFEVERQHLVGPVAFKCIDRGELRTHYLVRIPEDVMKGKITRSVPHTHTHTDTNQKPSKTPSDRALVIKLTLKWAGVVGNKFQLCSRALRVDIVRMRGAPSPAYVRMATAI